MSPEVRRAALRTAAKATFIASLGCSPPASTPPTAQSPPAQSPTAQSPPEQSPTNQSPPEQSPTTSTATQPSCAQHLDALATVERGELASDDPLRARVDVYGAFADVAARTGERTQQCCAEELARDGSGSAHRWACCSALPAPAPEACTPWGPPCPPALA